jgi:tetratricopeptide (TPR) repeat protein
VIVRAFLSALAFSVAIAASPSGALADIKLPRPSAAFTETMAGLVKQARWAEALRLLDSLPKAVREQPDLLYFRAQLLRKVNRATEALDIYTRLLSLQPDAQLIRLELAQTYYDLRDDPAAERYFRLALAGELPAADRKLAHDYLSAILRRRSWRITANLALGADSNLNAGTDSRTLQIFGLPFALSDQARRSSGFAVSGQLGAEQSKPLFGPVRLDTIVQGAGVYTRERAFDVLNLGV